jgi:DNA-binding NarL/FixJ family response regulator/indole-3-glycerol phosphate synthase
VREPLDVLAALRNPGVSVIADAGRRRPAAGASESGRERAVAQAAEFEAAGAAVIGLAFGTRRPAIEPADLSLVRTAVRIPLLHRGMCRTPAQIWAARAHGFDVVTLVAAALERPGLVSLLEGVETLGIAALVEVRDDQEAARAVRAGARLIGIDGPDARTLEVDSFARIARLLPEHVTTVAASGVRAPDDLRAFAAAGADAIIASPAEGRDDPGEVIAALVEAAGGAAAARPRETAAVRAADDRGRPPPRRRPASSGGIAVAAVDDHPVVLRGVAAALGELPDLHVVATATSLDALLSGLGPRADVVVLDVGLGDGPLTAANINRVVETGSAVVVFSEFSRPDGVRAAVQAGACGFVLKSDDVEELATAIRAAAAGGGWVSPELAFALLSDDATAPPHLTPREEEALRLYAVGMPIKMVARRMNVGIETAKQYIERVRLKYRKAGREAGSKVDLYRRAVEDGHVPPPA